MFPYWLLFSFFAAGAVIEQPKDYTQRRVYPVLAIGAVCIALIIGLRYQVGGDWDAYELIFIRSGYEDFGGALTRGDPGYWALNWIVQQLGGELWLVNLVAGLIFSWGLLTFAKEQSQPWLAVLVAVPYLVIVVAMGYTRQAIAIGVLMAGIAVHLRGGSALRFAVYVAVAALFHKTAVVVFPLVALAAPRTRILNLLIVVACGVLFYDFFLSSSVDRLITNYIEAAASSEGAAIRVAMSVIPALLFLAAGRRFGFAERERLIWRNFSLAALGVLALLVALPSSTVVDRLALYIIPLQLAVLSRVPDAFLTRSFGTILVVLYSMVIQYTWLNFAAHARFWVPYSIYPI